MPSPSDSYFQLRHVPTGLTLAKISCLRSFWGKGRGVLGFRSLPAGQGVWLPAVSSVHTCFVRFPLDIIFLDAALRTRAAYERVPPWRPWVAAHGARHVLELGAGTLARLPHPVEAGDLWELWKE